MFILGIVTALYLGLIPLGHWPEVLRLIPIRLANLERKNKNGLLNRRRLRTATNKHS